MIVLFITLICWGLSFQMYMSSTETLKGGGIQYSSLSNINDNYTFTKNHSFHQITNTNDNLFHFIQISDIHISTHVQTFQYNFDFFLTHFLPRIQPEVVFVTGDLTDAKDKRKLLSLQYLEEWITYRSTLNRHGILSRKDYWFDIRGNHDCFNVPSFTSELNYFKEMSVMKKPHFKFTLQKSFGEYSFIGFDGCPKYGTSRPFNFFSYIDADTMTQISTYIEQSEKTSNHIILMGHYPTTTSIFGTSHQGHSFNWIAKRITAYLCGHLHKLTMGLGETLYAIHKDEFMEIELADLKQHTKYRIMAIDHDMVSFRDLDASDIDTIPLLITNPKDAMFVLPHKEPVDMMAKSSHIRFLAWNTSIVQYVTVTIDGVALNGQPQFTGWNGNEGSSPLWTMSWNPSLYDDGKIHFLKLEMIDVHGNVGSQQIPFSFTIPRLNRKVGSVGEKFMKIGFAELFQDLFILSYMCVMNILLFTKLYVYKLEKKNSYTQFKKRFAAKVVKLDCERRSETFFISLRHSFLDTKHTLFASFLRLCELSRNNLAFYSIYLFGLYLSVGPLFIGEFIPKANPNEPNLGAFMMYGIRFFKDEQGSTLGQWVPSPDTWLQYIHELYYVFIPLLAYLSFCCTDSTLLYVQENPRVASPIHLRWYVKIFVVCCIVYQIVQSYLMSIFYGYIALILSPGKLWICLWYAYYFFHYWFVVVKRPNYHVSPSRKSVEYSELKEDYILSDHDGDDYHFSDKSNFLNKNPNIENKSIHFKKNKAKTG